MKRRYFKLKLKIITVILFLYLLGCGMLTYKEADEIRRVYTDKVSDGIYMSNFDETAEDDVDGEFFQAVYNAYECYGNRYESEIGFYSMVVDEITGEILAEEQNFLIVCRSEKINETLAVGKDRRILLLGDDFEYETSDSKYNLISWRYEYLELTGTCDDVFIYADQIKWRHKENGTGEYTYIPEQIEHKTYGEIVDIEEWGGGNYYEAFGMDSPLMVRSHCMVDLYNDGEEVETIRELNDEAKEICQQIYEDYVTGVDTEDYQGEDWLFTCYIGSTGYINDHLAMPHVYVFHPVSIALDSLSTFFICSTIFILIIIAIICMTINKAYEQQLSYENNRRDLTRGIAQELKTPLTIAKGYIEKWNSIEGTDRAKNAGIMIEEIDHMNKLVSDLLELSHFEAKKKQPIPESVDLHALLNTVLKRMKGTIDERNLVVADNTDVDKAQAGNFVVSADLEMMRTVLVNLVSNAVKYAEKNIIISLTGNNKKVKFSIENDGMVIYQDKLENVWDEFYSSDNNDSHHIAGSGLGLSISKQILILHKAKYGCVSALGKTEFWFEIKR